MHFSCALLCDTVLYFIMHGSWIVPLICGAIVHMTIILSPEKIKRSNILPYGEGYHNFHHTFPWDYSASEFGWKCNFNIATLFIDFFASIGWAYDCRKVTESLVYKRQFKMCCDSFNCEYTKKCIAWLFLWDLFDQLSHLVIIFRKSYIPYVLELFI